MNIIHSKTAVPNCRCTYTFTVAGLSCTSLYHHIRCGFLYKDCPTQQSLYYIGHMVSYGMSLFKLSSPLFYSQG